MFGKVGLSFPRYTASFAAIAGSSCFGCNGLLHLPWRPLIENGRKRTAVTQKCYILSSNASRGLLKLSLPRRGRSSETFPVKLGTNLPVWLEEQFSNNPLVIQKSHIIPGFHQDPSVVTAHLSAQPGELVRETQPDQVETLKVLGFRVSEP